MYDTDKGVEASELGLPTFCWPAKISYEGRVWSKVQMIRDDEGEVLYVIYADGKDLLKVFND